MNFRMIFSSVGRVLLIEAVLLLLPLLVAVIYSETCVTAFIIAIAVALIFGIVLTCALKPKTQTIYTKEGMVIVSLAWIFVSLIGCLPFIISGEIPNFFDALFETVSGFTTTGASILQDVESLSKGILFWRSFTHWIGGMGVLVFVMAVTSKNPDRSIHILKAEMPGPIVDKLVPRSKDTAKILYIIYLGLTAILFVLLLIGKMSVFESLIHAFGTAGTGGFGVKNNSIAGYSGYIQWVIAIFMFLFGVNFNVFYLIILGRFTQAFKSKELWVYTFVVISCVIIIALNILSTCSGFSEALRLSAFQVTAIISTTGFSTANFNLWPDLSKGVLFVLMFIGGCAGSTAGGFKLTRAIILAKSANNDLKRALHPKTMTTVKFEGKPIQEDTLNGVKSYLVLYIASIIFIFLLICYEPFGIETNLTAVVSCFNNVGPGFGAVGPIENYYCYNDISTVILTIAMLLGRLELYPFILTLAPTTWIRR